MKVDFDELPDPIDPLTTASFIDTKLTSFLSYLYLALQKQYRVDQIMRAHSLYGIAISRSHPYGRPGSGS